MYKILNRGFGLRLLAASLMVSTTVQAQWGDVSGNQLSADSAAASNHTLFIMDYSVWWGDSSAYSWAPGVGNTSFDAGNLTSYISGETNDLAAGNSPSGRPDGIYAAPSLSLYSNSSQDGPGESASSNSGLTWGYNSSDDSVIQYHVQLLTELGVEAITPDLTNNNYAHFGPGVSYATTADDGSNTDTAGNYAHLLKTLASNSVPMHVIPLLGAQGGEKAGTVDFSFTPGGSDNLSPFQRSLKFVLDGFAAHPGLAVTYKGQILVLAYSQSVDPGYNRDHYIQEADTQAQAIRNMGYSFTLRHITCLLSNPSDYPGFWAPSPGFSDHAPYSRTSNAVAADGGGLWSYMDQFYTANDGFCSYATVDGTSGARVEEMAMSTVSRSWPDGTPFLANRGGSVLNLYTSEARILDPIFVLCGQWNQFVNDTAGFSEYGAINYEPVFTGTDRSQVNNDLFMQLKNAISDYRGFESGAASARFTDICVRGPVGPAGSQSALFLTYILGNGGARQAPVRMVMKGMGPSLGAFMGAGAVAQHPTFSLSNNGSSPGGDLFTASNSGYGTAAAAFRNGAQAVSALASRAYVNSHSFVNLLNYNQPMQDCEPAVTVDLDPGTYNLEIDEAGYAGGSPGPIAHARAVVMDLTSPNRIIDMSGRGWVSSGANAVVIGFSVDGVAGPGYATKTLGNVSKRVQIHALGPVLANYGISPCLAQPSVTVYDANSNPISSWTGEGTQTLTLAPGAYTVILSNAVSGGSGDGIGIIDVQEG